MITDSAAETTINKGFPKVEQNHEKPLTRRAQKKTFRRKLAAKEEELEEARAASEVDPMTGLRNFGAFKRDVDLAAKRIVRDKPEKKTLIVILDADKLKVINDNLGHQEGDKYLISIAEALKEGTRRGTDMIYRIGGDEFALILPNTDEEGAEVMWNDSLNPAFIKRGISISAGATPLNPNDVESSLLKADSGMYGAKKDTQRNGENLLYTRIEK